MSFALAESLEILARTPATFRAMLDGLPEAWIHCDEGPETFSPFENVGHLVHGERADWIVRADIIRSARGDRTFAPYDRFAQRRESAGKSLTDLLDEFSQLRARNLETLRGWRLTEADLAREGIHPTFGAVTLRQLLAAWAVHDLGHLAQTARVMAKRYREAIGPWRAFLPIVDR